MSVESILALGRRRREALMRSTCQILRVGERAWDPKTGTYDPPSEDVIYDGPCRIKPTYSPAERDGSSAEREIVLQSYTVELPWAESTAADAINVADVFVMTGGDDVWLLNQRLPVGWVEYADARTHRRIVVWTEERRLNNG